MDHLWLREYNCFQQQNKMHLQCILDISLHRGQNICSLKCTYWIYIFCCNVKTGSVECLQIHTLEEAVFFRLEPTLSPLASSSMESPSSPSLLASAAFPPSPSVSEELCCWMACAQQAESSTRHGCSTCLHLPCAGGQPFSAMLWQPLALSDVLGQRNVTCLLRHSYRILNSSSHIAPYSTHWRGYNRCAFWGVSQYEGIS